MDTEPSCGKRVHNDLMEFSPLGCGQKLFLFQDVLDDFSLKR